MGELGDKVRRFALEAAGELGAMEERPAARRAIELLAGEGLLAWTVPQRFGGADTGGLAPRGAVSVRVLSEVRAALAYGSGMLDVMCVMQGLGSYPVAMGGAQALSSEVLPRVVSGESIAAFGLTEPGAGSSLSEIATRAEPDGDGWRITGTKTFISNAGIADFYSVLARTSGDVGDGEGLSMFYVPADRAGIEVRPFEVMAPHPIGDVEFTNVAVAPGEVLGEEGHGLALALGTLQRFRTSVAAAANGFARRALDEAIQRLSMREQFGRSLSAFQGLRFEVAEMDTRLRAAELLVAEAAEEVDNGEPAIQAVARAKLYATENASWICDRAIQYFGGLGVKRGETVERLYREVRALRIYEGTSEIQKLILAKEIFGGRQR